MKNNLRFDSPSVKYGTTVVNPKKIKHLIDLLKSIKDINGSIAEVGVYKGGSALHISKNTDEDIYLFDTFDGMKSHTKNDGEWGIGSFSDNDYDNVKNIFKKFQNVKIFKGIFPNETSHNILNVKFKFVHLDVDNYVPYKESLEFFYSRMVKGGIIVFDDYDQECCPGANKAVDEFLLNKPEKLIKNVSVYFIKE